MRATTWRPSRSPCGVLQRLGVTTLILTAATGGIRADLRPGDLMLLSDHLNLLGVNPLRGLTTIGWARASPT